jgi:hypothetical protein
MPAGLSDPAHVAFGVVIVAVVVTAVAQMTLDVIVGPVMGVVIPAHHVAIGVVPVHVVPQVVAFGVVPVHVVPPEVALGIVGGGRLALLGHGVPPL